VGQWWNNTDRENGAMVEYTEGENGAMVEYTDRGKWGNGGIILTGEMEKWWNILTGDNVAMVE